MILAFDPERNWTGKLDFSVLLDMAVIRPGHILILHLKCEPSLCAVFCLLRKISENMRIGESQVHQGAVLDIDEMYLLIILYSLKMD